MATRIGLGIAIAANAAGMFFIGLALYFVWLYLMETTNHLRHEYQLGVALSLTYAAGSGLTAALLAGIFKKALAPRTFRWIAWPGLGLSAILLVALLGTVAFDLIQRTT